VPFPHVVVMEGHYEYRVHPESLVLVTSAENVRISGRRKSRKKRLRGGMAEKMGVTEKDVDQEELRLGEEHELEHTSDRKFARQIALDHLAEHPHYYSRIATFDPDRPEREVTVRELVGKVKRTP
jgi:hypothetical protein